MGWLKMQDGMKTELIATDDWLESEKETILIYGPPKSGKTWAYCSFIEKTINNGNHVWIINTDFGVSKTLKQYFSDKLPDVKKFIHYYPLTDMSEADKIAKDILVNSKPNDLVVIDLMSDMWEMAQNKFIEESSGGDIVNYYVNASKDSKKFGLFAGSQWSYVRGLHNLIAAPFTGKTKCNVIAVCAHKELDVEKSISGKIKNPEYEATGARPAGEPRLAFQFNTIVFVNKLNKGNERYFQVVGDRGSNVDQKMISFGKNFEEKFSEYRKKFY